MNFWKNLSMARYILLLASMDKHDPSASPEHVLLHADPMPTDSGLNTIRVGCFCLF